MAKAKITSAGQPCQNCGTPVIDIETGHTKPVKGSFFGTDGQYHLPGSFMGVDGRYHQNQSFVGVDGRYTDSESFDAEEKHNQGNVTA